MFEKAKYYWHVATDKYFIEVAYIEPIPDNVKYVMPPAPLEKKFIIYQNDEVDYTEDPTKATCFGFLLGMLITNRLRAECKDLPNLHFSMISVNDTMFIHTVQNGSAVAFQSKKEAIDFAGEEVAQKYMGEPGVYGIGSITQINTEKKEKNQFIAIDVRDEETLNRMQAKFPGGTYKGFAVKIQVRPQTKAQ